MNWKDRDFSSVEQWLHYVPEELLSLRWACDQCKHEFEPPWTKKTHPRGCIVGDDNSKWLAPIRFQVPCPSCAAPVWFDIPRVPMRGTYSFYGDEAYRDLGEYFLFNYSLVGTDAVWIDEFERQFVDLKEKCWPEKSSDEWTWHTKDMWSHDNRRRHKQFSNWNRLQVSAAFDGLFRFISEGRPKLYVANMSAIYRKPGGKKDAKVREHVKRLAFAQFVTRVIDTSTQAGVRPRFYFDTEKYDGTNRNFIQRWAQESFFGSQVCILYPFLERGLHVPEPTFVAPGSHAFLEIADFVSYVVARHIAHSLQNREPDLHSSRLGSIEYFGFTYKDEVRRLPSNGFPFLEFLGPDPRWT